MFDYGIDLEGSEVDVAFGPEHAANEVKIKSELVVGSESRPLGAVRCHNIGGEEQYDSFHSLVLGFEGGVLFDDLLFLALADQVLVELAQQMDFQGVVIVYLGIGAHLERVEVLFLQTAYR